MFASELSGIQKNDAKLQKISYPIAIYSNKWGFADVSKLYAAVCRFWNSCQITPMAWRKRDNNGGHSHMTACGIKTSNLDVGKGH